MTEPAVRIEGLTIRYGDQPPSVAGLDLTVPDGRSLAIMGRSGCGKSSLCLCLNGLIPNTIHAEMDGRVLVFGREPGNGAVADMADLVGIVFQDFESQLVSTSVELELAFGAENRAVPRAELQRRVDTYLRLLSLEDVRFRDPSSLSGGQKQLLAIGAVLALEPRMLVLDEPTTDLDPVAQRHILSLARDVAGLAGRALIVVEHDAEVLTTMDEVSLMASGTVVATDAAGRLLRQPRLLEQCGVRPPEVADLFDRLGFRELPLTVDDGLALLRDARCETRVVSPRQDSGAGKPILEADDVSFSYPVANVAAVQNLQVRIREGEFVAIIGQNGGGKTTLAKLLSGLLHPTEGSILVAGRSTRGTSRSLLARMVGYVFQNPDHQIFCPTVFDEISFGPRNFGIDKAEVERRVAESLEAVGLLGSERRDPFALTKGERQRVAVASVLACRPAVLVLDEPTTGLDYVQQRSMMDMLLSLRMRGHTIVIVTHCMWVVTAYADRTIVMRDGGVLLDGPTRTVFHQEDLLRAAHIEPSPIVRLSNRLGTEALTVAQMAQSLSLSVRPTA